MSTRARELLIIVSLPIVVLAAAVALAVAITPSPDVECQALQNDIELQGTALAQCTQGACVINASDLISVRRDFARYLKHCTKPAE